jgi:uncharacterized repeat protein (TIGR03803 family)
VPPGLDAIIALAASGVPHHVARTLILKGVCLVNSRNTARSALTICGALLTSTCLCTQSRAGGLTTIASFNGGNGANPQYSGVTFDAQGNLYGTTVGGGANGDGTVWEIAKGSNTITTIAAFNGGNGQGPAAGVTFDAQGNLYGTTNQGGGNGDGTVWEIAKGSNTITTIASFNVSNGSNPFAGVTLDAQGNLYGTTRFGGAGSDGTVWEITKGSNTITTIASFSGSNGRTPYGGVTLDAQGNLYGTTRLGGANNDGAVWEIAKGSGTITPQASFNGGNGKAPYAGVTSDAQGNLYGTTTAGGANSAGTIWEIASGSGTLTTLFSFNTTNGQMPVGGVTLDAQGNLYGTTNMGGADGTGAIWEIAAGSGTLTTLASFNTTSGSFPQSSVTLDPQGNLYGTTNGGGAGDVGTVWQFTGSVPEPSSLVMGFTSLALVGGVLVLKRH